MVGDTQARAISGFLKTIALEAFTNETLHIKKSTVTTLLQSCTTTKCQQVLKNILKLYQELDNEEMTELYGNVNLSKLLMKLAELLTGAISNENKKIISTIKSAFEH
jgi:hypothetical protein